MNSMKGSVSTETTEMILIFTNNLLKIDGTVYYSKNERCRINASL